MNNCLVARLINIPGLLICVTFSTFALWVHNNLLPYIYFIFAVCAIIAHIYLYCTRCASYGKDCYVFGGFIAKQFFKKRHQGPSETDDSIVASIWILMAVFPVPFLLYYQDYLLAALNIMLFWGWFYVHHETACLKCDNTWCGLNKRRK